MNVRILSLIVATVGMIASSTADAGEFTVINRSSETIWVATHARVTGSSGGLSGAYSFGVDESYSYWETRGWFRVEPGQSRDVYDGPRDRIYVRMTTGSGINGEVIVPNNHYGEISKFVHSNRFLIRRFDDDSPCYFEAGQGRLATSFSASRSQLQAICNAVDGFYLVESHTDFTVR